MSFLKDFMTYTSGNESHPVYDQYAGLVALSSIISRRVWIPQGYFNVYPNLYVVLVGPAGNRKTTAMSTCKKLLRELEDIPFSAECQTKESVVQELSGYSRTFKVSEDSPPIEYHPMTICVTELSQFLGVNSGHMVDFLTTVYDQDFYDLKTKNKGHETIIGPYITMLACTTPSWITAYLKQDVISGGFSRRAIFVYETEKSQRIAFPQITDKMSDAWDRVVAYAQKLMHVGGEFKWEIEASQWYENWYQNLQFPESEVLATFYESKHIQVLKIAMLIALSESTDLVMRIPYLETALAIIDLAEENLEKVFIGIGRNELHSLARKVMEVLDMAPKKAMPETVIRNMLFADANAPEIVQILNHLASTKQIKYVDVRVGTEPPKRYVAHAAKYKEGTLS